MASIGFNLAGIMFSIAGLVSALKGGSIVPFIPIGMMFIVIGSTVMRR